MDWRSESVDPVRLLYLPLQKANEGSFHEMSRFINVSVYDLADLLVYCSERSGYDLSQISDLTVQLKK